MTISQSPSPTGTKPPTGEGLPGDSGQNKWIGIKMSSFIPGGLVSEYIRINGSYSAWPVVNAYVYDVWAFAVELQDEQSRNKALYVFQYSRAATGTGGPYEAIVVPVDHTITFGGPANLRKVGMGVSSWQEFTASTSTMVLSGGEDIPEWASGGTYLLNSERIGWKNPSTLEWDMLTRGKDYSVDSNSVVTFETPVKGLFYYSYKIGRENYSANPEVSQFIRGDQGLIVNMWILLNTRPTASELGQFDYHDMPNYIKDIDIALTLR